MEALIAFILKNFTAVLLALGFIAAIIAIRNKEPPRSATYAAEVFLAFYLLFSIGISYFYNFIMHVFFGEMTAAFIGWADSPFQAEVGFASLGFSLVGLYAARAGFGARLAAILGPAMFLWGAAAVHAREMVTAGNFEPGNAGTVFYTDIITPIVGFALLFWRYRPRSA